MIEIEFDFPGLSPSMARKAVEELRRQINESPQKPESSRFIKRSKDSQDAGSILAIVLGSAAVTVLAEHIGYALQNLSQRYSSTAVMKIGDIEVELRGDAASNAAEILAQIKR